MPDISNDVLIQDLIQDALMVMERSVNALPADVQLKTAAGVHSGGEMEIRIRMRAGYVPRVSLHLVGPDGEIELASGGGVAV